MVNFPKLHAEERKNHWSYADSFGTREYEYIKSFVHHNYTIGYHTHSFYELNIVLSGEGYHYIEQMPYHAKPGCVFLIPPHIQHGYISKQDLNVYHMLIHRDFLETCFAEFKQTDGFYLLFETEPYLRAHHQKDIFLVLSSSELALLQQDIDIIVSCKQLPDSNIYINAIAKKMLCHLCMMFTVRFGVDHAPVVLKKDLASIVDCLNYIHQNFNEKLTLTQLSQKLNISRSTFIRQFTKICGCSPYEYIQRYRIKKAKEYLHAGNRSLSWIAQECGFYDVSHMRKYLNAYDGEG